MSSCRSETARRGHDIIGSMTSSKQNVMENVMHPGSRMPLGFPHFPMTL